MTGKRVGMLDEIRGISIILMVVYHALYSLNTIFNVDIPLLNNEIINLLRIVFAFIFIFISGICCRYSHNNLKRGIICLGLGFVLTIVTSIFIPEQVIIFGILSLLGIGMIAFGLFEKYITKIPSLIGFAVMIFLFLITTPISSGSIGFDGLFTFKIPLILYQSDYLFPFGITNQSFSSADYYPLFPYTFIFLSGAYFGKLVKDNKLPNFVYKTHINWLSSIGRNTLWIYLLHQPIIYFSLQIFFKLKG